VTKRKPLYFNLNNQWKIGKIGLFCFGIVIIVTSQIFTKEVFASWKNMDRTDISENISNNTGSSIAPQIMADAYNNTYAIWIDSTTGNSDIFFSKWTATGCGGNGCWTKMDGSEGSENVSNDSGSSTLPKFSLTDSGTPYLVWLDNSTGNYEIFFRKWTVGAGSGVCGAGIDDCWTKMDGSAGTDNVSGTALNSGSTQFAIDNDNNPYIAWEEPVNGKTQIYFRKWTFGVGWTKMDGTPGTDNVSNDSGNNSHLAQFAIDSSNNPCLTWSVDLTGNGDIYFKKWTQGVGWTKMDGTPGADNVSNNSSASGLPKMRLDSLGFPIIIWRDVTSANGEIFFTKWQPGTGWTKMDGTLGYENISNTLGDSDSIDFKLDQSNIPNVVWDDATTGTRDIYFTKWTGGVGWTKMDGTLGHDNVSNTATASRYPKIGLSSQGFPNIVWREAVSVYNYEIYFRKWTPGLGWTKMGDVAGTDNLSDNGNSFSDYPEIVLRNTNLPNVIWQDNIDGNNEIYFTHWIIDQEDTVDISAAVDATLTLSLSAANCSLGTFSAAGLSTCNYDTQISTNGSLGYTAYIRADGMLRNAANQISDVADGDVGVTNIGGVSTEEEYGVSTSKAGETITQNNSGSACSNLANQLATAMPASVLLTSDQSFASATGPISSDSTTLCHAAVITGTTEAGSYAQTVTVTAVGNF